MKELTDRVIDAVAENNGVLRPAIVQLMAEAWDEGYTTGNAHNGRRDANPYKADDV